MPTVFKTNCRRSSRESTKRRPTGLRTVDDAKHRLLPVYIHHPGRADEGLLHHDLDRFSEPWRRTRTASAAAGADTIPPRRAAPTRSMARSVARSDINLYALRLRRRPGQPVAGTNYAGRLRRVQVGVVGDRGPEKDRRPRLPPSRSSSAACIKARRHTGGEWAAPVRLQSESIIEVNLPYLFTQGDWAALVEVGSASGVGWTRIICLHLAVKIDRSSLEGSSLVNGDRS